MLTLHISRRDEDVYHEPQRYKPRGIVPMPATEVLECLEIY